MTLQQYTALVIELSEAAKAGGASDCLSCYGKYKGTIAQYLREQLGDDYHAFQKAYMGVCQEQGGFIGVLDYTDCGCIYLKKVLNALSAIYEKKWSA